MHINTLVRLGFAAALALTAAALQPTMTAAQGKPARAEQRFLKEAIQGDLAEVEVGKLAQQKGQTQGAKQFGEMLTHDHGQHLQRARDMAQQLGVSVPQAPSAKQKRVYQRLSKTGEARFDREFARAMVKDHREDIAAYEKQARSKSRLAQFAQETLPVLRKHLKEAQSLAGERRSQR